MAMVRTLALVVTALAWCVSLVSGPAFAQVRGGERRGEPGQFEFFVLSLSWSPSYCEAEGDRRHDIQCDRPFSFVLHGLWPQYAQGYPQNCDAGGQRVPERVLDGNLDLMPSKGLIIHQWRKHGSCSGLDPKTYFDFARAAYGKIKRPPAFEALTTPQVVDPDQVEADFRSVNPGLPADAIAVSCDRRRLREVRICVKKDLTGYVSCPEVDRDACRAGQTYLPALRGR